MLEVSSQNELERIRRQAVENAIWIPDDADEQLKRERQRRSIYRYLLDELSNAAKREASKYEDGIDKLEYTLLPEALEIAQEIQFALVSDPHKDIKKSWHFWKHYDRVLDLVREKNIPYIERSQLESAVTRYLNSPLRAKIVDRLFVDILVAAELFAFADEMINPYFRSASPIRQSHSLSTYVKGQFWNGVVLAGIILCALWLNAQNVLGSTFASWIVGISIGLFFLLLAISTFALPFAWRHQHASRKKVVSLLQVMANTYSELKSDGAISAHHIRRAAQNAADQGVKWPATLFALLDDIIAREGRF